MWLEEAEVERVMGWKKLLAYIAGSVDQALLRRNEYLLTENRILRQQITGHMRLTDGERKTLAEIGKRSGKQALTEVATIVKPDTIPAWHRQLIAKKFDGSQHRHAPGRPKLNAEIEALVVHMTKENRSCAATNSDKLSEGCCDKIWWRCEAGWPHRPSEWPHR